jgi:hypothetical protein
MVLFQRHSWAAPLTIGVLALVALDATKEYLGEMVAWGAGAIILIAVGLLYSASSRKP